MSAALLKKSLEIVEENLPSNGNKNKNKPFKKKKEDQIDHRQERPSIQDIRLKNKEQCKKAEENIAKLLKLSSKSKSIDKDTADKMIKRARTGRYVIPEQKVKEEEKSIFTDADFEAFEKEYFCS